MTALATGPEAATRKRSRPMSAGGCVAVSVLLLAALIVGFLGYLFTASGIQEQGAQSRLYSTFATELGQDIGPLGPTGPGAPVAVLDIASIGVRNLVVVEGTTPENLTAGPGHLRNTPLPGQLGLSVIYGRRATFGAPFAGLHRLRLGDKITAYTQQGKSVYKVVAIGDSQEPVKDTTLNRLALLTASSPDVPAFYLEVDADLVTTAHNGPVQMLPSHSARPSEALVAKRSRRPCADHDLGPRARDRGGQRRLRSCPLVALAGLPDCWQHRRCWRSSGTCMRRRRRPPCRTSTDAETEPLMRAY